MSLDRAYDLWRETNKTSLLGGVTIPERHTKYANEHLRISNKADKGCHFFVSQCVYDIHKTKDFLSDYYYHALEQEREMVPIIFSLTPCGSLKTLEFTKWLGIKIPKWLENDLIHSTDILSNSMNACKHTALELMDYCALKKIPLGFNVESIAIRKEEIDASVELLKWLKSVV